METLEKKYSRAHIGEKFITKQGYELEVIDGGTKLGMNIIRIGEWVAEVRHVHARDGSLKYPYHKTVQGVGYYGVGNYVAKINGKHTKAYKLWHDMIRRCYSELRMQKFPTYRQVEVTEDWHNFQIFARWFYEESNYKEGLVLDKDLLSEKNNKIYSPDTCIFITPHLNSFMARSSDFVKGARECNGRWYARIKKNGVEKALGVFDTEHEAITAYTKARRIESLILREEYKGILPDKVLQRIK